MDILIQKQGWTLWYQDERGEVYAKELIRSSDGGAMGHRGRYATE